MDTRPIPSDLTLGVSIVDPDGIFAGMAGDGASERRQGHGTIYTGTRAALLAVADRLEHYAKRHDFSTEQQETSYLATVLNMRVSIQDASECLTRRRRGRRRDERPAGV